MHKHSIHKRIAGVLVPTGHSVEVNQNFPLESLIRSCDELARSAARNRASYKDEVAFGYTIDGELAYFVSNVFFYSWPNHLNEERNEKQDSREGPRQSRRPRTSANGANSTS
jgi:hypothetical protein